MSEVSLVVAGWGPGVWTPRFALPLESSRALELFQRLAVREPEYGRSLRVPVSPGQTPRPAARLGHAVGVCSAL